MELQKLLSYTRKAVDEYRMIEEGDHIAVGISGGKDSLTLLYALHGLKRFYPKKFELSAITVDLGFEDFDLSPIQALCQELNIPYRIESSDIYEILFHVRKESNPCSLCAKMRKGALNQAIKEMGCNKIAYAHHKDDIIETMLLSLIFEGRFYSFSPKTYLDRTDLTVIRPMMFVDEKDVIGFKNKYQLPVVKSKCPVDGYTKRQYVKELLRQLNHENPVSAKGCFMQSLMEISKAGPNGSFIQEHKKSPCSKSLYLFCKGNCFLTSKEFCHLFESALSALHTARLLLLSLQFQVLNLRDTIHSFQSLTIFYSCNNYNNLHAFYRF